MTAPDTTEVKMLEILVAWRDHVEKLKKWNGKLPTDEAVRQLKGLLVEAENKGYEVGIKNRSFVEKSKDRRIAELEKAYAALQQTRQERSE